MPETARLLAQVENAATAITSIWPLKTFIAVNPLSGFEVRSFKDAVKQGADLFGGCGLPTRAMGRSALAEKKIDPAVLKTVLEKHGCLELYEEMVSGPLADYTDQPASESRNSSVNRLVTKYLAAFLDEGQAAWSMPGREKGFYACWKHMAVYDGQIPDNTLLKDLPDEATYALLDLIQDVPDEQRERIMQRHLAALPGWSGFVKWRAHQKDYPWQQAYPITLAELLAVRMALTKMTGETMRSVSGVPVVNEGLFWLEAWEETYRRDLARQLQVTWNQEEDAGRPDAQFVFCIDVRSEVFRRHLEATGAYGTFGFAGFFGVPIKHKRFGDELAVNSCPVLLQPQFETIEIACPGHEADAEKRLKRLTTAKRLKQTLQQLKKDIAASFATVEFTGIFFGLGMIGKTVIPRSYGALSSAIKHLFTPAAEMDVTHTKTSDSPYGLSLSERVFHAEAALRVMGLTKNFAPYIFLCGHGSETVNNPYASGLDCGACGGNHGEPNARVMAAVLNDPAVRAKLKERDLHIPDDTVFVAAQHNTTTDHVKIYGTHDIPETILNDLEAARKNANEERSLRLTTDHKPETRAADWAQVRPEWGLAGNASFIVGPRRMTQHLDLKGRSFLHSYEWEEDPDGKALEIILTAPMVVAEWISMQYYFSTVDNTNYGSGSKTTQNVTGKIGVMQGNGSDLMSGLPLQSVMSADDRLYHEPLRLMTVVKAPLSRVRQVIAENDILQILFDNSWVALLVIDPHSSKFFRYGEGKIWHDIQQRVATESVEATIHDTQSTKSPQSVKSLEPAM